MDAILADLSNDLDDETMHYLIKEVQLGWHQDAVTARIRQKQYGASAERPRETKSIDGVGRWVASVDPISFHSWGQHEGYEVWQDKGFLKSYLRDNPESAIKSGGTKFQIGYRKSYDL